MNQRALHLCHSLWYESESFTSLPPFMIWIRELYISAALYDMNKRALRLCSSLRLTEKKSIQERQLAHERNIQSVSQWAAWKRHFLAEFRTSQPNCFSPHFCWCDQQTGGQGSNWRSGFKMEVKVQSGGQGLNVIWIVEWYLPGMCT